MLKSIPTKYNGIEFRSRLEARWAMYFDYIGLKYNYEQEGYILENGVYYLPDFKIGVNTYIEIKPEGGATDDAIQKCKLLSHGLKCNVYLFEGLPSDKPQKGWYFDEGKIHEIEVSYTAYSVKKWGETPYYFPTEGTLLTNYDEYMIENIIKHKFY